MRGSPGWRCTSDPVDEQWRFELLRWIRRELGIPDTIMTGLLTPEGLRAAVSLFPGKILFWVNDHLPTDSNVGFSDGTLAEELRIIDEAVGPERAVVVIDGQHGTELPYVMARGVTLERWTREYRTGEVILYGALKVPPFEEEG